MIVAEYIERESLINHVEDLPTWGADGNLLDREDVISSIENRLAADVAPVRHGRWIPQVVLGEKAWDCSECKTLGSPHWKWCPVCGAKMDLEDE